MRNMTWMLCLIQLSLGLSAYAGTEGIIKKVDFIPTAGKAIIILKYEGRGQFRTIQNDLHSNIIIEAENLALPAQLTRTIDAASEDSPVVQITPYRSDSNGKVISKFVIAVRGKSEIVDTNTPGVYQLEVKGKRLASSAGAGEKEPETLKRISWAEKDNVKLKMAAPDKTEETAKKLIEVLNSDAAEKEYFGSKVDFESTNAEIHDVFRLIGEKTGLNLVTDSEVKATASYSLKDIPWDQLLDIVVQQNSLKAFAVGNVIRITTMSNFNKSQEEKKKEIMLGDELEPTIMAVVPLSFARAEDISTMIGKLLVSSATGTSASAAANAQSTAALQTNPNAQAKDSLAQAFQRGRVEVDTRSNSLVITNTKTAIERIRRLVKELDVALPQVLIDSKIVIASEDFSRSVGVKYAGRVTSTGTGRAGAGIGFNGGGIAVTQDSTSTSTPAFAISSSENSGVFGFQLGAGKHGNINALISLNELNRQAKTIASPRVIASNKMPATVSDTLKVPVPDGIDTNGNQKQRLDEVGLKLNVTPQITSSGAIFMKVSVEQGALGTGGTTNKGITTDVMVDSGSTLVLGGVYQYSTTKSSDGIPLLKDLPFIGGLFRSDGTAASKSELMIFITPQILESSKGGAALGLM